MKKTSIPFIAALQIFLSVTLASCQLGLQPAPPTSTPTVTPTITPVFTPTETVTPSPTALPPNVFTGKSCSRIKELGRIGKGRATQMFYTPDGKFLLVVSPGGLSLFDAKEMNPVWETSTEKSLQEAGLEAFSGTIFALDSDENLQIFESDHGTLLDSVKKNEGFMGATVAEDGRQISGAGFDGIVYVYGTDNFDQQGKITGPGASPDAMFGDMLYLDLKYSPDRKYLAIATLRAEVDLYRPSGAFVRKIEPLNPDYDNRIFPTSLAFSRNGKIIAVEYENGQTWVTSTTGSSAGHLLEGVQPSVSADGSTLALKTGNGVALFNTSMGQLISQLEGTQASLGSSFSPDGQTLAIAFPGRVEFRNWKTRQGLKTANTSLSDYRQIAVSHDGNVLAAASAAGIDLYQTRFWDHLVLDDQHPVDDLKFNEDDTLLFAAGPESIFIWDLKDRKIAKELPVAEKILHMDVSADGKKIVVVTGSNAVKLYDLTTGSVTQLNDIGDTFTKALFTTDGKNILALHGNKSIFISTPDHPLLSGFIDSKETIDMVISANGESLLTFNQDSNYDSDMGLYHLASGEKVSTIPAGKAFAFSPLNNLLVLSPYNDDPWRFREIDGQASCEAKNITVDARQILFLPGGDRLFLLGENGMIYIFGIDE